MARKSRKNLPQPEQAAASVLLPELEEAKMPAAIYGRLSVEDGGRIVVRFKYEQSIQDTVKALHTG